MVLVRCRVTSVDRSLMQVRLPSQNYIPEPHLRHNTLPL